jgi:regulator of replication initiation timing
MRMILEVIDRTVVKTGNYEIFWLIDFFRILSKSSSLNRVSIEEFTKLKMENQQLKHLLQEMVLKLGQFTSSFTKSNTLKSSGSGSSNAYIISKN